MSTWKHQYTTHETWTLKSGNREVHATWQFEEVYIPFSEPWMLLVSEAAPGALSNARILGGANYNAHTNHGRVSGVISGG